MADAKAQNIPVLSYTAQPFRPSFVRGQNLLLQLVVLEYGASIIALVAITQIFLRSLRNSLEG